MKRGGWCGLEYKNRTYRTARASATCTCPIARPTISPRSRVTAASATDDAACALFVPRRAHLRVDVLSGAERLRATLVCVLSVEPALQPLLDEPANNLDLRMPKLK